MHRTALGRPFWFLAQFITTAASLRSSASRLREDVDCPVSSSTIPDCTYFVCSQAGDDCASLAEYWGITEAQFIDYNPIVGPACSNFVVNQGYCVEENYGRGPPPTSTTSSSTISTSTSLATGVPSPTQSGLIGSCTRFHKVQSGDTCAGIVENYHEFTLKEFYSWNPAIGDACEHLEVGVYVCTAVPGTPTAPITSTVSSTQTGVYPTQSGIASNCDAFYQVEPGDTCQGIVHNYNNTFTLSQFYQWNPAVGSSCSQLVAGDYVCIGITGGTTLSTITRSSTSTTPSGPSPTQSGIVNNCNRFYQAVPGDTCGSIAAQFCTFTSSTFEQWNPAVGKSCTQLLVGDYYCVGVPDTPPQCLSSSTTPSPTTTSGGAPSPHQTGIASNCVKYYQASPGDTCGSIASKFCTFTSSTFQQWNPAVGSGCTELLSGEYYCVAVPGTPTTCLPTAQPTTTTHGPQPQQTGIPSDCNEYHEVASGDTCQEIEQAHGISNAQFDSWNPAINSQCSNLLVGFYVCVGV